MNIEKITVRATQSGQTMEVVVFSKRAHRIEGGPWRRRPLRQMRTDANP
jgi:hypothetical protein